MMPTDASNLPRLGEGHQNEARVDNILQRREQRMQQNNMQTQKRQKQPLQSSAQNSSNMVGDTPKGDPRQWLKLLKKKKVR